MDLSSLPFNVQHRIALLLDQTPDLPASPSASTLSDSSGVDQPSATPPTVGGTGVRNNNSIQQWHLPAHDLPTQLQQSTAGVVFRHAFGPDKLQACRIEAEQVLQQARGAGLGGGLPMHAWKDLQAVWLKRQQQVEARHTALVSLVDAMLQLQQCLAGSFDVMGPPSFQLARYPGNSSRYVRHADASPSSPARSITAIYYLNPGWDNNLNGGKLCLYDKSNKKDSSGAELAQLVAPAGDTLVVFDSHVEHEVLPSFADRYALTVWFSRKSKRDPAAQHAQGDTTADTAAQHNTNTDSAAQCDLADQLPHTANSAPPQQYPSTHALSISSASGQQQQSSCDPQSFSAASTTADVPSKAQSSAPIARAGAVTTAATAVTPTATLRNAHFSQQIATAAAEKRPGYGAADDCVQQQSVRDRLLSHAQATSSCNSGSSPAAASLDPHTSSIGPSKTLDNFTDPMHSSTSATEASHQASKPTHTSPDSSRAKQHAARPEQMRSHSAPMPEPVVHSTQGFNSAPLSSGHTTKPRPGSIFVSIAAYRDPECQWTVCDLFKQAHHPQLVTVGVVWQIDAVEDAAFVRVAGSNKRHQQVRQIQIPWHEATGPCKARHLAQQLLNDEEFYLQIDSHMRFVAGWDTKLRQMLQQAEAMSSHGKAVISSYPPPYEGEGASASLPPTLDPTLMEAQGWDPDGMLRLVGKSIPASPTPEVAPALFWAAGFSFSRAQLIFEVPYNPHLPFLFFGEEMSMLARMWTRGWDVFTPTQAVAFHLWSRVYRHTFQGDIPVDTEAKARSQAHVRRLLHCNEDMQSSEPLLQASGNSSCRQNGCFALGTLRSMHEFWQHCGIESSMMSRCNS